MDYDKRYFKILGQYEHKNSKRNLLRLKEILKYKQEGDLLEIGPGQGGLLSLAQEYFNVSAIEISDYAIHVLKKKQINVLKGDISKISLKKNTYDVILAFNILEHMQDPFKVIKNFYNSLKPGGILIGSVPNNMGILGRFFTIYSNYTDKTHISTFKTNKWAKLFKRTGFKIKFFGEIMFTRNFSFYIKSFLWKYFGMNLIFICKKQNLY